MARKANPKITLTYPKEFFPSPEPPSGVRLEENVRVAMRDGVRLAVDIYRPGRDGRYPALLSLAPYSKDIQRKPPHWSHAIESGATAFYVPNGYVHVIAQGRGCGLSEGQWQWFDEKERSDGYDLIEWIAAQPWCNGNVGMIGDSYFSWSQYQAAGAQAPHLKCICQCDGTIDLYRDVCYQGGIYNAAQFLDMWIPYQQKMSAWPGDVEGKLAPMNLLYELACRPYDGPWYRERSGRARLVKIKCAVMSIVPQGGHMHARGQLEGFPLINAPKRLVVVPRTGFWSHLRYLTDKPLNRHMLRWFDHWLKGIDTGIMDEPEVAIFDSATRQWRYENEYPLARTQWTRFYLRANPSGPASAPPYGLIDPAPPGDEPPDSYRLPDSLAQTLAGQPVLAYATPPLAHDLRLWGPLSLTLYGSSDRIDTAWHVKLNELNERGIVPVSRGILKASFRKVDAARSKPGRPFHPFEQQELLEPHKVYEFQIELTPVFHTFRAGSRLQLTIASEDIQYSSTLRTIDVQLLPWPVENTVHHDAAHRSHLVLPVIPDAPEIRPVTPPLSEVNWPFVPATWSPNTDGFPLVGE
jgi:predicted acyl esterase